MTSFDYVIIPTRGNWFQTSPLEHESDDLAGNTVSSVLCVTNEKDIALQRQIWSTFFTAWWFRKTKIPDWAAILVLVKILWVMISKIYWQFWHSFFKYTYENSYNIYAIEIMWRKLVCSVWYQCQWKCDVCIYYDISLYQRIQYWSDYIYREIVPPRETVAIARVAIAIVGRGGWGSLP